MRWYKTPERVIGGSLFFSSLNYVNERPSLSAKTFETLRRRALATAPIYKYQKVKIRKILGKIHGMQGYPVKFFNYLAYFSGIAVWLPEDWVILPYDTRVLWQENESARWRLLKVARIIPDLDDVATSSKDDWLKLKAVLNSLSKFIDTFLDFDPGQFLSKIITKDDYPIYENLGFYNTVNDVVIDANWDKIKKDLAYYGYKFED